MAVSGGKPFYISVWQQITLEASKALEIFNRLTQAVTPMMAAQGFHTILAYLEDFLISGNSKHECKLAYRQFIHLLSELRFNINWEKAVAPAQQLTFLGIQIDTVLRQICSPKSKPCKLQQLLSDTLIKRSVTKRDLEPCWQWINQSILYLSARHLGAQALVKTCAWTQNCKKKK